MRADVSTPPPRLNAGGGPLSPATTSIAASPRATATGPYSGCTSEQRRRLVPRRLGPSRDSDPSPAQARSSTCTGHRFDLSPSWSLTASGAAAITSSQQLRPSADYQDCAGARLPRQLVIQRHGYRARCATGCHRLSRAPAWVADTSGQYLLGGTSSSPRGRVRYPPAPAGGIQRVTGYAWQSRGSLRAPRGASTWATSGQNARSPPSLPDREPPFAATSPGTFDRGERAD